MNDQEYQMLADKYENTQTPFRVVLFFSKPTENLHACTILDGKTPIAVGLPIPRRMANMPVEGCHVSRTPLWDQYITAGELYWHPVKTESNKSKRGKFILKTKEPGADLGKHGEDSDDVKAMEMKLPSDPPPPAGPEMS